ncbi:hypothetical protein SNE40_007055 [Patella caerulea]|uniref:G-protein coupled receptors family 1 profile domain-containing protein n=1 Tax=Patella caerulea TaxID=87958 RepID=A0AAN8PT85_PATCE
MDRPMYLSVLSILYHEPLDLNVQHVFVAYIFPVLACSAILGNFLFVASVLANELRKKTTGILLMSSNIASIILTVASTCIVYYPWIFRQRQRTGTKIPCNILVFTHHTMATWSVYLLSCACVERYIAICHPMSKYSIRSQTVVRQSLKLLVGTFIASFIINSPMIWFSGLTVVQGLPDFANVTFCYYTEENWYMKIHEYVEMTLYCIIPFIMICFCNVSIIRKIYFHKTILELFRLEDRQSCERIGNWSLPHRTQAIKLATILLPIAFLHLVFSLAVVLSVILEETVTRNSSDKLLLLTVSYCAAQLQAGFYFYVNIALSPVFRRAFKRLFRCETPVSSQSDFRSHQYPSVSNDRF